jgi:hypothetical protein
MTRLVRAEFTKLRTTRLIYGMAAVMAAFAVLTVVAGMAFAGREGNPSLSADSLAMFVAGPVALASGAALVGTVVWVLVVEGLLMSLINIPSLGKWLPSAAAAAAITSPGGAHLSRLGGTLLLAGYALALALAGTRLVVRRDIT